MDTISALATPPGIGGIAVIRVSGGQAIDIVDICFKGKAGLKSSDSHTVIYGKFYDNETMIDTVLVSIFKEPNSYTGEDVVEISCHGGFLVAGEIINTLIKQGARLAEQGEFTKRAFLNGKIDLTQVEAVADIIHSNSIQGTHTSARQLAGEFTSRLKEFRNQLIEIAGLLELELDFADEDVELINKIEISDKITKAYKYCSDLADSYKSAEILRSGFFVGIAGYPNAGKSKLFNALLQKERAIVSPIPGTTRDFIEENLMLGGITVRITDTAGIRESVDIIEVEGIKLAESVLEQSNMILVINDISISEINSDNLLEELKKKFPETIILLLQNKIDLEQKVANINNRRDRSEICLYISAKTGDGITELKSIIENHAKLCADSITDILVNQRQSNLLRQASVDLENAGNAVKEGDENELIAIDIRNAAKKLGELTGESWNEEVLKAIFGSFCIGK